MVFLPFEFCDALAARAALGKRVVRPYLMSPMKASRPLTPGEIELARSMFGNAIDYSQVRMARRRWWPFQPKNVVMAPTGNIHFHPDSDLWSEDFSAERLSLQGLFIHEMTHVWQAQKRGRFYLVLMRHPFCQYHYTVKPGRRFDRYGLEQQAEIVRHAFIAQHSGGTKLASAPVALPFAWRAVQQNRQNS